MTAYDNWLEQPYQEKYAREDAVEERFDQLCREPAFDCCNFDNFIEAINDEVLTPEKERIEECLNAHKFEQLGRLIWARVSDYYEEKAQKQAEEDVANGSCDEPDCDDNF